MAESRYQEQARRIREAMAAGLIRPVDREKQIRDQERRQAMAGIAGELAGVAGGVGGLWAADALGLNPAKEGAKQGTNALTTAMLGGGGTAAGAGGGAAAAPTLLSANALGGGASAPVAASGGGLAGALLPAAGIGAGAYMGYQSLKGLGNVADGKDMDMQQQAALGLPTMGLSFAYNPLKKLMGGGKSDAQMARDSLRQVGQEMGVIGPDYNVNLAGGGQYNVGLDGNVMLQNQGTENLLNPNDPNVQARAQGGERYAYETDPTRKDTGDLIGLMDPLAEIWAQKASGGNAETQERLRAQGAGYGVNAAQSGGGADSIKGFYEAAGLDRDKAYGMILQMGKDGVIDDGRRDSYLASIDRLYGVK